MRVPAEAIQSSRLVALAEMSVSPLGRPFGLLPQANYKPVIVRVHREKTSDVIEAIANGRPFVQKRSEMRIAYRCASIRPHIYKHLVRSPIMYSFDYLSYHSKNPLISRHQTGARLAISPV